MELICFGGLIGGFIQQTEVLGYKHQTCSTENVLDQCTQLLACFRGLKKGVAPLLFILYSTNIIIFTVILYYLIIVMTNSTGNSFIISMLLQLISILIPSLQLIYTALLAEDGFTAMKDMLIVLR